MTARASLLTAFYVGVWLTAMSVWLVAQLDWRPAFVKVWDSLSLPSVGIACLAACLAASIGLLILAPVTRLPRRMRLMPWPMAVLGTVFLFQGILRVSSASELREALTVLAQSVGSGLGLGVFTGFVLSFGEPAEGVGPSGINAKINHPMLIGFLCLVAVAGLAFLGVDRPRHDAKLKEFEQFESTEARLQIGVISESVLGARFGVVRITDHGVTNALVLDADEWREMADLWARAERTRQPVSQPVGMVRDTNPVDPTRLEISGGPTIRLVASSPHGHTVAYELGRPDAQRFDSAVTRVTSALQE